MAENAQNLARNHEFLWQKAEYIECPICHHNFHTFETRDVRPTLYRCLNFNDDKHKGLNDCPYGWYGDI